MRIKKWIRALIFYTPAISAGVEAHSIKDIGVSLLLFTIAFTAAAIIFISGKCVFQKGIGTFLEGPF